MRNFDELNEREILALVISDEEKTAASTPTSADGLRENYLSSAKCSPKWRPRRTRIDGG